MELLPVLALYGANASGKSNVLNALNDLLDFMGHGAKISQSAFRTFTPFLFEEEYRVQPTRFTLRLAAKDRIYTYSLEVGSDRILLEAMDYTSTATRRSRKVFGRQWNEEEDQYKTEFGKELDTVYRQLESSLKPREPFIGLLSRVDIPVIQPFQRWLLEWLPRLEVGSADREIEQAANFAMSRHPGILPFVSPMMRLFDMSVESVQVKIRHTDTEPDIQVVSLHRTPQGVVSFSFDQESMGTQRMFPLLVQASHAFTTGSVMLVDELDASLHPNMVRQFVKLFQNPETNPKGAQLIFTSHDITLMRNLLRRDQIWFTEKRSDGSTDLFPLTDFKVRDDAAIDRWYLDGIFGAVPILPLQEEVESVLGGKE